MKISNRDHFRMAIVVASVRNFPASASSKLTAQQLFNMLRRTYVRIASNIFVPTLVSKILGYFRNATCLNGSFCYVKNDDIKYINCRNINCQLLICKCLQLAIDIFNKTELI